MDTTKLIDPALWAQSGGMTGLIIFALFFALGIFLWGQLKIYEMHRGDMKILLEMHAEERTSWGKIVDDRQKETNATQKETNEAMRAMALAINELNARSRRFTNGHEHD